MTDQTISELLVLFLLTLACGRVFFNKHVRSDALSILPVFSFVLSILNICAWGLSLAEIGIFLLSMAVSIWNMRALLRLNAQLVIDHYSPWFVIISTINLLIVLVSAIVIFVNRPVKVTAKKEGVTETVTLYTGTFASGFTEVTKPFQKTTAKVWKYEVVQQNPTQAVKQPVTVLFIPDKCSSVALCRPFLMKLAADGYTVYSAEFYAKDMRWFKNIFDSSLFRRFAFCERKLRHPAEYAFYANDFSTNLAQEYNTFVTLVYQGVSLRSIQNETVILAGDEISQKALPIAFRQNKKLLDGTFNVALVDRYTAGFGPIEQTDPLLALFLGRQRDSTMYISAHMAHAIEKAVSRFTTKQRAVAKRLEAMTASASTATVTQQTDQGTGAATTPDDEQPSPGDEKYSINTDENDAQSTVIPAAPNTATTAAIEPPTTENTAVTPETTPTNTNTTASDQPENSVTTE